MDLGIFLSVLSLLAAGTLISFINFYRSFIRIPLLRRLRPGVYARYISMIPLVGSAQLWLSILFVPQGSWLTPLALAVSLFDTGGLHWFFVSLAVLPFRRRIPVRPEEARDLPAVHAVLASAFPTEAEAKLVDSMRASGRLTISLVAEVDGLVVGHVGFSRVTIEGALGGLGLAPLAVDPAHQRTGVGRRLVEEGLATAAARAEAIGAGFVVVLGDPDYYRRFGFLRASDRGLSNEFGATDHFLVLELRPGALPDVGGMVKFAPEFSPWRIPG